MRVNAAVAVVMSVLVLHAMPVQGQESQPVEVTPYLALGTAGTSPIGAAVTFPLTSWLGYETDVAYRGGEGEVHGLSTNASLLFFFPRVGRFTPYLAAGVGLAPYGAAVFDLDGRPIGTRSRLAMTVNYGGGVKAAVNDQLDLRTDVRWFKPIGHRGGDVFRVAQGLSFDVVKRGRSDGVRGLPIAFSR